MIFFMCWIQAMIVVLIACMSLGVSLDSLAVSITANFISIFFGILFFQSYRATVVRKNVLQYWSIPMMVMFGVASVTFLNVSHFKSGIGEKVVLDYYSLFILASIIAMFVNFLKPPEKHMQI